MKFTHYSLLDFTVNITSTDLGINLSIGGQKGSFFGGVTVAREKANISKNVDDTGSGVFNYSANNSGTLSLVLNQLSEQVNTIINNIASKYHDPDNQAWKKATFGIEIFKAGIDKPVVSASFCMLEQVPELGIESEASNRTFVFLAMEISEVQVAR